MINTLSRRLEAKLEERTGVKVRHCYQCKKCSAGCPVAFAMDLLPHEVMKNVQYGQEERLLKCSTIWLCSACETCSTRCPNDIDIARVMDGLREMSLASGMASEREVRSFHKSFLNGIRIAGKTNESVLIGQYKALTGRVFDDLGLGLVMFLKGKVKVVPRLVKDRGSVRRIFDRTAKKGNQP
jgi:heterodisulfide reductase subunit C2